MKNSLVLLSFLAALYAPARAGAAVVETFGGIQIAATAAPGYLSSSQINNNPGNFERRYFGIPYGGGRMETTAGGAGLSYSFESWMAPGLNTLGYFSYRSNSEDPVNLIGNGENVLRLTFSDLTLLQTISFQINISSATGGDSLQVYLAEGTRDTAVLDIPFLKFEGVDFSRIEGVALSGGRFSPGTSFVLESVTTVPEPSFLPLAALGGLGFLRRRR